MKKAREYSDRKYQERIVEAGSYFDSMDIYLAYKDGCEDTNKEYKEILNESLDLIKLMSEYLPYNKAVRDPISVAVERIKNKIK